MFEELTKMAKENRGGGCLKGIKSKIIYLPN
jgi:hypothetical protein